MKLTTPLALTALILGLAPAASQAAVKTYTIDATHSEVSFRVKHLVTYVRGSFGTFEGTIVMNTDDISKSSVTFTIDAASIDTGNEDRDKHLRSEDFFAVEKYPTITFQSTSIRSQGGENRYVVVGDFTMRGVTKQLTLPVELTGEVADPRGNIKAGFATETTINRQDYGVTWNRSLDQGGLLLGNDVDVTINLETGLQKPAG